VTVPKSNRGRQYLEALRAGDAAIGSAIDLAERFAALIGAGDTGLADWLSTAESSSTSALRSNVRPVLLGAAEGSCLAGGLKLGAERDRQHEDGARPSRRIFRPRGFCRAESVHWRRFCVLRSAVPTHAGKGTKSRRVRPASDHVEAPSAEPVGLTTGGSWAWRRPSATVLDARSSRSESGVHAIEGRRTVRGCRQPHLVPAAPLAQRAALVRVGGAGASVRSSYAGSRVAAHRRPIGPSLMREHRRLYGVRAGP
jgi:hypothetical protein